MSTITLPQQDIAAVTKGDFTSTAFKAYIDGNGTLSKCVAWYDKTEILNSLIGAGPVEVESITPHKTSRDLFVVKLKKGVSARPARQGTPVTETVKQSGSSFGPDMAPEEYIQFCQGIYEDAFRIVALNVESHAPGKELVSNPDVMKSIIEVAYNFTGRAIMQLAPVIKLPGPPIPEEEKSDQEYLNKIEGFVNNLSSRDDPETFRTARTKIESTEKLNQSDKTRLLKKITEIELQGD